MKVPSLSWDATSFLSLKVTRCDGRTETGAGAGVDDGVQQFSWSGEADDEGNLK